MQDASAYNAHPLAATRTILLLILSPAALSWWRIRGGLNYAPVGRYPELQRMYLDSRQYEMIITI